MALIVREFDFVGVVQELYDHANLSAHEAMRGHIREERDNIQQAWYGVH